MIDPAAQKILETRAANAPSAPKAFELTLPYPVSANRYWRTVAANGRAMVFVSDEAKKFKDEVWWRARSAGLRTPFTTAVELKITLIPKNRVCMDLDNALKVTIDALKGIAYDDDAQVYKIIAERAEPGIEACCKVEISEFIPEPPPLFAAA